MQDIISTNALKFNMNFQHDQFGFGCRGMKLLLKLVRSWIILEDQPVTKTSESDYCAKAL